MKSFVSFLIEYLNPEQRKKYSSIAIKPEARAATDHFFGVNNDEIEEPIKGYDEDKNEIHRNVESHIGKPLSHDEYRSGMTTDKYGRQVKLSKLIKDQPLQKEFAADKSRHGASSFNTVTARTVRGTEVAGQTNPEPNVEHPSGHSWRRGTNGGSCKDIETGFNNMYLDDEIHQGSVATFVKDHNGQEIYRATLQPYVNTKGKYAYALDSEYGIKHPSFTEHAKNVASKLSAEHDEDAPIFHKVDSVYDQNGVGSMVSPNIKAEDVHKILNSEYTPNSIANRHSGDIYHAAIKNEHATPEHLEKALMSSKWNDNLHLAALENPNVTTSQLSRFLDTDVWGSSKANAIRHKNADQSILKKGLSPFQPETAHDAVAEHPKATPEMLDKILKVPYDSIDSVYGSHSRMMALQHKNLPHNHLMAALDPQSKIPHHIRVGVAPNPNLTKNQISDIIEGKMTPNVNKDSYDSIRYVHHVMKNPKITSDHITQLLRHPTPEIRKQALQHDKVKPEHIAMALNDPDIGIKADAYAHPLATHEQISAGLNNPDEVINRSALSNPNATSEHVSQALSKNDSRLYIRAIKHPKISDADLKKATYDIVNNNGVDNTTKFSLFKNPKLNIDHISHALDNSDKAAENNQARFIALVSTTGATIGENHDLRKQIIHKALTHHSPYVRGVAFNRGSDDLEPNLVHRIAKDHPDPAVREDAATWLHHKTFWPPQ